MALNWHQLLEIQDITAVHRAKYVFMIRQPMKVFCFFVFFFASDPFHCGHSGSLSPPCDYFPNSRQNLYVISMTDGVKAIME